MLVTSTKKSFSHKTTPNAKRNFLGIHHSIRRNYTKNYLNEFCFNFNRRYNYMDLFDRVLNVAVNVHSALSSWGINDGFPTVKEVANFVTVYF